MKKYLLLFLFFSFCFTKFTISDEWDTSQTDEIKKLEGNLLYNYVSGNETEVENILNKIISIDKKVFERDVEILNYWYYIDEEMELNEGVAPNYLPNNRQHAFVVLGYALNSDGSLKQEAKDRCDVAYESAMKYPNTLIFVTGGGTASKNKTVTEGGQMKDYLVNIKGLDESRIVVEDKAMDTIQNAKKTVVKLIEHEIKTITVITSDYHIRRGSILFKGESMLAAERLGIEPIEILENAVCKTGKQTEGKLFEGYALASIMGVEFSPTLLLRSIPMILSSAYNYISINYL